MRIRFKINMFYIINMGSYRKYGRRRSSKNKRKSGKVTFTTSDGRRVSFTPKKKRSGPTPSHLKSYTNKMKKLGNAYRSGALGNMSWKSAVKKYMKKGGPAIPGSKRSSRRRSRRSSRR